MNTLEELSLRFIMYRAKLINLFRKNPLKIKIYHEQEYLEDSGITCDKEIAHVIEAMNQIDGVSTSNSCWNVPGENKGYVLIHDQQGHFISHLEKKLWMDQRYWLDKSNGSEEPYVLVRMNQEFSKKERKNKGYIETEIRDWWDMLYLATTEYRENSKP